MSVQALTAVFGLGREVNGARRLVLLALANFANEEGLCWPKIETIAKLAGIKRERTVTDCLTWLERHGHIERRVNAAAGSSGNIPVGKRPNIYRLRCVAPLSDSDTPPLSDSDTPPLSDSDRQNRHVEPSYEPALKSHSRQEGPVDSAQGGVDDPITRQVVVAITQSLGLRRDAREWLPDLVSRALETMTPQTVHDRATRGGVTNARSLPKVMAKRLGIPPPRA